MNKFTTEYLGSLGQESLLFNFSKITPDSCLYIDPRDFESTYGFDLKTPIVREILTSTRVDRFSDLIILVDSTTFSNFPDKEYDKLLVNIAQSSPIRIADIGSARVTTILADGIQVAVFYTAANKLTFDFIAVSKHKIPRSITKFIL